MTFAVVNNLAYVAVLRHVQFLHERADGRYPVRLVGRMFRPQERLQHRFMSKATLANDCSRPSYHPKFIS